MITTRFLASVNIFVDSTQIQSVLASLSKLKGIEEVYEVKGEYDVVTLVSTPTIEEFRDILQKQIMKIKGVKGTITNIILHQCKGSRCQLKNALKSTV
jgi:DNA-binding Lrp family transcriptional regulator